MEENSGKDEDDAEREESPEARVATLTASLAQRERELEELRSELAAERHARKKGGNSIDKILSPSFGPSLSPSFGPSLGLKSTIKKL